VNDLERAEIRSKLEAGDYAGVTLLLERVQVRPRKPRSSEPRSSEPLTARARKLWFFYRMTLEEYEVLLEASDGTCYACGALPEEGRSLHVDHDHSCCPGRRSCGKCVRGLLCIRCNWMLGVADDDIQRLERLILYVRAYS
jgi:hypothetical protein